MHDWAGLPCIALGVPSTPESVGQALPRFVQCRNRTAVQGTLHCRITLMGVVTYQVQTNSFSLSIYTPGRRSLHPE